MIIASTAVAVGSVAGGLWLSWVLDFPSGATIVLLQALLYLFTITVPWLRGHPGKA
jgi:ABC-type Mn2+/Zn2+ transport system permease subunit